MTTKKAATPKAKPKKKATKKATKKAASKKTAPTQKAKAKGATRKPEKKTANPRKAKPGNGTDTKKRNQLIQQTAYFIAEQRGFEGGDPVQDWLKAEKQVDKMLKEHRT